MIGADFNVKVSVRNARLVRLIRERFGTSAALSRLAGVSPSSLSALITMRNSPTRVDGSWTDPAAQVASALGVEPGEIWPRHLERVKLRRASTEMELSQDEVAGLMAPAPDPARAFEHKSMIERLATRLDGRKAEALRWRLREGPDARYKDMADEFGISVPRAQQLERAAFLAMRREAVRLGIRSYVEAAE